MKTTSKMLPGRDRKDVRRTHLMGEELKIVKVAGENLISDQDDQGTKADKPEELIKSINSEIDAYEEKMKEFMTRNDGVILDAEAALSNVGESQSQQVTSDSPEWLAGIQTLTHLKAKFLGEGINSFGSKTLL